MEASDFKTGEYRVNGGIDAAPLECKGRCCGPEVSKLVWSLKSPFVLTEEVHQAAGCVALDCERDVGNPFFQLRKKSFD